MKDNFWSLLKESVIMQALLTIMLVGATIYLIVVGKPVPEILGASTTLVLGYFFGAKTGVAQGRLAATNERARSDANAAASNSGY